MNNETVVTIFGRLGANPELKYTKDSEAVCSFSIAENHPGIEKPTWHKVVVWGKQGEDCNLHLRKGKPVFVRGQNIEKKFETQDGLKRVVEFRAETVGFSMLQ